MIWGATLPIRCIDVQMYRCRDVGRREYGEIWGDIKNIRRSKIKGRIGKNRVSS